MERVRSILMSKLVGDRIYSLRKKLGLSQEEFANRIGVSRQVVSKWEMNQVVPLTDKLKKISEEFNVSYEEIFNDKIDVNNKRRKVFKYVVMYLILVVIEIGIIFVYTYIQNNKGMKYNCLGVQSYYIDKIYDSDDINYNYVTLKNRDNNIKTVKISKLIATYLDSGKSYEFTFKGVNDTLDMDYIFNNNEIINIRYIENYVNSNDGLSCKKKR